MSHHTPPGGLKPASTLCAAALGLLLAATWLLLVFSGQGAPLRSVFERTPTTARLAPRGRPLTPATTRAAAAGRPRHPAAPLPICKLQLDQGPFATNCNVLRNVCVDQVGEGGAAACFVVYPAAPAAALVAGAFCGLAHPLRQVLDAPLHGQRTATLSAAVPHRTRRAASSCTTLGTGRGGPMGRRSASPSWRAGGTAARTITPSGMRRACTM